MSLRGHWNAVAGLWLAVALAACSQVRPEVEIVEKALASQKRDLETAGTALAVLWESAAELRAGTPPERDAAKRQLDELHQRFAAEWDALDVPVTHAMVASAAAREAEARIVAQARLHLTNNQGAPAWCGGNGCGGVCGGVCQPSEVCFEGYCSCVPQCEGRSCGADGCGGYCGGLGGGCKTGEVCSDEATCVVPRSEPVACQPSCSLDGRPAVAATTRVSPDTKDHTPPAWAVKNGGESFKTLDRIEAYVKALDVRAGAHQTQLAEHEKLVLSVAAASKGVTDAEERLEEVEAEWKAALERARAKKQKPADSAEWVEGQTETTAARASLKTARAELARLSGELAKAKAATEQLSRSRERLLVESARLRRLAVAWRDASEAVARAEEAETAARASREALRTAMLARNAQALELAERRWRDSDALLLSAADAAWARCDGKVCAAADPVVDEACVMLGEGKFDGCPGGADGDALVKRLKGYVEARRAALEAGTKGEAAVRARTMLDKALSESVQRFLVLRPGDSVVGKALSEAALARSAEGFLTPDAARGLRQAIATAKAKAGRQAGVLGSWAPRIEACPSDGAGRASVEFTAHSIVIDGVACSLGGEPGEEATGIVAGCDRRKVVMSWKVTGDRLRLEQGKDVRSLHRCVGKEDELIPVAETALEALKSDPALDGRLARELEQISALASVVQRIVDGQKTRRHLTAVLRKERMSL